MDVKKPNCPMKQSARKKELRMASHARKTTRRYSLRKVKKNRGTTGKPPFAIRLNDEVNNQGCVIKKIESALKNEWPDLRANRSSCTLTIDGPKRELFLVLDPIVAKAIEQTEAIHTRARDKASQDRKPERKLKVTSRVSSDTSTVSIDVGTQDQDLVKPDVINIADELSHATIDAWRDYNPVDEYYPRLTNELMLVPA